MKIKLQYFDISKIYWIIGPSAANVSELEVGAYYQFTPNGFVDHFLKKRIDCSEYDHVYVVCNEDKYHCCCPTKTPISEKDVALLKLSGVKILYTPNYTL